MMIESIINKAIQFFHLNPGGAFFVLAVAMTAGRKAAKHYWGGAPITFTSLRKYPGEALEIGLIVLAIAFSIYFLFM